MALKTERSRIRFKDIESVEPYEPAIQTGRSTLFAEPPANEERRMGSQSLSVGEELRRARVEAGLDLADVAAHLRIRSNFLSALEEGHPDALPGITYAIGYVRTYAAFLGLEPDVAVRRFKEEAAGLNSKTQLVFPSPAPEGRVPGLILMLVAAVLAGGAYGGWYWVSERDGGLRDLVPAVPERLAQLIEGEAPSLPPIAEGQRPAGIDDGKSLNPPETTASSTVSPAPDTAPSVAPLSAQPTLQSALGAASPGPVPQVPADQAPAAQAPAARTAAIQPTLPAQSTVLPATGPQAASRPSGAQETTLVAEPTASTASRSTADRALDTTARPERVTDGSGDDVPAAPRIASLIGASEAAVPASRSAAGPIDRVMIRATGDSWVQVRDAQGTALFTRVLREGDIYRVPDQAGLRLATGNAGALQIVVDGNPAPRLGDFGEVVRNVLLDPTRLSAGTATGSIR